MTTAHFQPAQALAVWYVEKYGEPLKSSHVAEIVRDDLLALRPRSEGKRKGDKLDTKGPLGFGMEW